MNTMEPAAKSRKPRRVGHFAHVSTSGATQERELYSAKEHRRRTGKSTLLRNLIVVVCVLAVGVGIWVNVPRIQGFLTQAFFKTTEIPAGQLREIRIPDGASAMGIAKILKDNDLITDQLAFIAAVEAKGATSSLKPGNYQLTTGLANERLVDQLVAGPAAMGIKLTIPEGLTIEQTAAVVEKACGIPADQFIKECHSANSYADQFPFLKDCPDNSLEGYLFPKTYQIPEGAAASDVVRLMLKQFQTETASLDLSYTASRDLSLRDVVIIASLVERETYQPDERPLVASVIMNRLRDKMKLQICSTVVYALGPNSRDWGVNPLLYADLEVDSPYNTYRIDGLPPGPICSPQLASLKAAAQPQETSYLYYVLTSKEGHHTFCKNAEEFEAANVVYRKVFGLN
ncbi:MAG: endolytic transglycosylase MltG [Actinomycetia bacterium]|nr:endolytic transglycosylase MltG [Actinomycetes bacterium]